MCILKLFSDTDSFKDWTQSTEIPLCSVYDKGEQRTRRARHRHYRISFDVSDRDGSDFRGQAQDAIRFLTRYAEPIRKLLQSHDVDLGYLDFPIYSRLDGQVANQNDHIPKELIKLAAELDLGIEMSLYDRAFVEDD